MNIASAARLLSLAAIWGGSFLFMRIASDEVNAYWIAESRLLLASVFLSVVAIAGRKALSLGQQWRHYLILGLFNSAAPFLLFAYAAAEVSASLLSIINATAPVWGALITAIASRQLPLPRQALGMVVGISGVSVLIGMDASVQASASMLPVIAALVATFCYGIASYYASTSQGIGPFANAHGSLWGSAMILLPASFWVGGPTVASTDAAIALIALGVLCTGVAYLLFFKILADDGPTSALSVTFVIPLFGVLFGHLFLDEAIGWHTFGGGLLILGGTALVTGFLPGQLRRLKRSS
ncbi:MAG: DMT family transporter [Halieaceae bacterium]|nr:DMT family transporter [Halieaceae bacterium]